MARRTITPTGVEKTFHPDQIIVSKTDLQGRLTYVNDLFVEISGYDEAELVGQPHNVIRHPSMPRGVFRLLWERISSGEEIFAYVVNLSADGSHYWVLAHVTPTFDTAGAVVGYHSNRRTASPEAITQVTALYRRLLDEEARHASAREAVEAGKQALERELEAAGASYDEWVWALTNDTDAGRAAA
ncbi:PAS domain S-box-containing protein [Nocardioides sp. J9]|uniref:PAS domain-containing protein n=1 Tax=unclassified Nocardioides TaxID=2615069 RepID=UPI00055CDF2B|nr:MULTISPECIES: PAS domain-containing protein [unclassified Nocardioides]TWH03926.1 PAS domain S-box-containing protein [Nocardioides sp. J9]